MKSFFPIAVSIVFLFFRAALPLAAQETTELDEVVVTDSVEEIATTEVEGVAETSLEGEQFSLWNQDSPADVAKKVPNFFATETGNSGFGDIMTIRGVGNTPFFSNPAVIYYVDGVPFGDVFSYASSLVDVESVDVYRGPQGARFGRNAYGGAVNVTTKRPENEWHGAFGIGGGSYDRFTTNASLSGAVIEDVLKFRIAGFHTERDGFIDNKTLNKDTDDESRSGGGASLFWTPSSEWEISLSGSWETFDNGSSRLQSLYNYDSVNSNVEGQMQGDSATAGLRIAYDGDDFRFSSVTAYRYWEIDPFVQDIDLIAFPIGFTRIQQDQEQWSEEIRFSSPADSESRFDWSAGVYVATAETNHDGFNSAGPAPTTKYNLDQDDYAVFAEGGVELTERLKAILGLRYDYVDKDMFRSNSFFEPAGTNFSDHWDHVTPTFTLEYEATEETLLYASTSYTYKPGGFTAFDNPVPMLGRAGLSEYDEETNWASEIGVIATGMDGRLRGRAAVFYYDIEDYQVERVFLTPTFDYAVVNADEATSYGAELELEFDLAPGLTIDGSIGWTETELDRFTDPVTGASLSGNEAPYVPEFDFVLGGTWHGESGLFARLEYRGVGDTYFDDFNTNRFKQKAYGLVNAQVGYRRDNYVFSVYGTNLTNEDYYTNINPAIPITGGGGGASGAPQEVGAKFTIEF